MKILSVSDVELSFIYSPLILNRFSDVDLVISCGDLSYYYLEYIISMLNKPLVYVLGNHANRTELGEEGERRAPWGASNIDRKVIHLEGHLIAGIEGSLLYNHGPHQYSQSEMWSMVLSLVPIFFVNKIQYGRFLDIFVTHAPPWGIHDQKDLPHQGIKAFRWLIDVFKPTYLFHGHTHVYQSSTETQTMVGKTRVINTYGYKVTSL